MNEEVAGQTYLVNLLTADTTLAGLVSGVWTRSVPQTAPFPEVKIDRQDADDLYVINLHRVWADLSFLVRGIVRWPSSEPQDWTEAQSIADRIDTLLHKHEGQDTNVLVHAYREESYTDETIEGGDLFLHAGGIYRVRVTDI